MALGGGTFISQNKILPGAYINFISVSKSTANLSDRGVAALAIPMSWGKNDEVFTVTLEDLQKKCKSIFGYDYTAVEMKGIRDLFINAVKCHFYKLNNDAVKAKTSDEFAEAKYSGSCGNKIKIVISNVVSDDTLYNIETYYDNVLVDEQKNVTTENIKNNDYVNFDVSKFPGVTTGINLLNGDDGDITANDYQKFLDAIESYSFNTLGCLSTDDVIKQLYVSFTKRMRDDAGVKFQTVLHKYNNADYEGVISVENELLNETDDSKKSSLVYYVLGAEAGCAVNKTLTNTKYTGEFEINTLYTQTELEDALLKGKLIFHNVGKEVRILEDINTFVSVTSEKSTDFSNNQTIRVLDQIANDIAALFANKYLGKIPNDKSGRISLWNDIVKHHKELENIGAIESFNRDNLIVEQGDTKKSVLVADYITPVNAMAQLYMNVIVQ